MISRVAIAMNYGVTALFAYAAIVKLVSLEAFTVKLLKITYMPVSFIPALTIAIPFLEVLAVMLCLITGNERKGWGMIYLLMVLFTSHLLIIYFFFPDETCSCGGILEGISPGWHLLMNLGISLYAGFRVMRLSRSL